MLTNKAIELIQEAIISSIEHKLNYMAFGDGASTPTDEDTSLEQELFRKKYIEKIVNRTDNEIVISCWLSSLELNDETLREIGIFEDSEDGELVSRDLLSQALEKSEEIELWLDYKIEYDVIINE